MANTMDKLRELSERIVARSQHCGNTKDAIAMQEHAAELDAILRESEAQVPVAATLDDAAADPALTLDVARELLRDAAAGIRQLAARATPRTEPAEGRGACPRDCGCVVHCRREQLQAVDTPPAGDGARVSEAEEQDYKPFDEEDEHDDTGVESEIEFTAGDPAANVEMRPYVTPKGSGRVYMVSRPREGARVSEEAVRDALRAVIGWSVPDVARRIAEHINRTAGDGAPQPTHSKGAAR